MNDSIQPPPEWCEGNDLDNFVLLLQGLKDSLADEDTGESTGEDTGADAGRPCVPRPAEAAGERTGD